MGRIGEAEKYLRRATEVAPHFAQAWSDLGVALSKLGRTDEAVAAWEKALREDPRCQTAQKNLSMLRRIRSAR